MDITTKDLKIIRTGLELAIHDIDCRLAGWTPENNSKFDVQYWEAWRREAKRISNDVGIILNR